MSILQQIASALPYGQTVLSKADNAYSFSKHKTLAVYNQTKTRVIQTKNNYIELRQNFNKALYGITQETINEILLRFERFVAIPKEKRTPQTLQYARERLQLIFQAFFTEYVLKNRLVCHENVQALIERGNKFCVHYIVPIYISLKAAILVTKQMVLEFLESKFREVKLTYESSKDSIVMFISSGNLSEQKLRQRLFEGVDSFKRFTVQAVNKGLEVRVDREFLLQNFDKVAINLGKIAKEMKEKGEGNIVEIKKRSKDLYKQVLERIKAKEIELASQMKRPSPSLCEERE